MNERYDYAGDPDHMDSEATFSSESEAKIVNDQRREDTLVMSMMANAQNQDNEESFNTAAERHQQMNEHFTNQSHQNFITANSNYDTA